MAPGFQRTIRLKRRLQRWHIFFIGIGGVIGIGFFSGPSRTTAAAGPGGALLAIVIVGIVAVAVMEAICHLICIWPIPNAMVEFVRAFVDEDLGTAVGVLYWYTQCVTFSVLMSAIGKLTDYWGEVYMRKTGVYIATPLVILVINALPVEVFGWVELVGGIIKLLLVIGVFLLMLVLNLGVGSGIFIGTTFINDGIQHNENVAHTKFAAVLTCFPPSIFTFIGIELLTTTAFEARDPREMRFPARNIGWFSLCLYALLAGVFVSNVSWADQNLPKLFSQALTMATDQRIQWKVEKIDSDVAAAPLIVLLHLGYKFLPGFINGCLIYSAFSAANTSLYVASRQLYGLTRTITVNSESNFLRGFLGWMGQVEHRTRSPWPALFISVLVLYWLPFINRKNNYQALDDLQTVLSGIGSVSCILVWCSQCVAYSFFYHWRTKHWAELRKRVKYAALLDYDNTGWFYIGQPYLSYLATFSTLAIVFFFNTASMWNGERLVVKAISAFASPAVLLIVYLLKKFTRPKNQWKFWNNLSRWYDFEQQIQYLTDVIFPDDPDAESDHGVELIGGEREEIKPAQAVIGDQRSVSDLSTTVISSGGNHVNPPPTTIGDLRMEPHAPDQVFQVVDEYSAEERNGPVSPLQAGELMGHDLNDDNRTGIYITTSHDSFNNNNNRYYNGRDTLSPADAVSYSQQTQTQSQPQSSHIEHELVGSTVSAQNYNNTYNSNGIPPTFQYDPPPMRHFRSHSNSNISDISEADAGYDYTSPNYSNYSNQQRQQQQQQQQRINPRYNYNNTISNSIAAQGYLLDSHSTNAPTAPHARAQVPARRPVPIRGASSVESMQRRGVHEVEGSGNARHELG